MTTKPSPTDIAAIADRYRQAWVAHDVDAIVSMHTLDARFHSHGRDVAVHGRDALRTEFARVLNRFPGFGVEVHRLLFGDRHWVLDWTLSFQPRGSERLGFRCIDLVEIDEDGLISDKDTYYDLAEAGAAMGAAS
jgi:hypothetical protein